MAPDERQRLLARAALAGTILVFIVIVTSAFLRMVQFGIGCEDWPACYGAAQRFPGAASPAYAGLVPWMRAAHRLAAAAVGVLALAVAVAAWTRRPRRALIAPAAGLLALTVFLAILGWATPGSALPAVTLGNVLGGMAMLALFWWLRLEAARAPRAGTPPLLAAGMLGLLLLALQYGLGTLVSANFASAACPGFPGCDSDAQATGWDPAAFDPWQRAEAGAAGGAARRTLHMAHRWGGWIALGYFALLAGLWRRRGIGARGLILAAVALLCGQFALGVAIVLLGVPLALAVAHNALAGLLLLPVLSLVFQSRPAEAAAVSEARQMWTSK